MQQFTDLFTEIQSNQHSVCRRHVATSSKGLTASASAALLRSSTPSGAASTKLTNFFVSRPRELSYLQLPAGIIPVTQEFEKHGLTGTGKIDSEQHCCNECLGYGDLSPLPLPGVPGDLDVGLLYLVDFLCLPFVSAIQASLYLHWQAG